MVHCRVVRFTLVLGTAVLAASVAAAQQRPMPLPLPLPTQGTPDEEAACKPDVRRYCPNLGDDQLRTLACLQKERARISKACLKVLEDHGQ